MVHILCSKMSTIYMRSHGNICGIIEKYAKGTLRDAIKPIFRHGKQTWFCQGLEGLVNVVLYLLGEAALRYMYMYTCMWTSGGKVTDK